MTLSKAQTTVLMYMLDHGATHSGRGGWNTNTLRAMERQGLVKVWKTWTYCVDWLLTPKGKELAMQLRAAERTARGDD